MNRMAWRSATLAFVLLVAVPAGAVEPDQLRLYQSSQQRARQMARELVTEVLDIQLAQFRFNGLTDLPIYRDILSMRRNVGTLIDSEMRDVVELLATAQQVDNDTKRQELFAAARNKIRDVVRTLSAERQRLLRRIRVAKVTEQAQHLIALQRETLKTTTLLPGIGDLDLRETRAVSAVQDQRDINTLYLQLVNELAAVRGWGPPAGPAAADGLRMLKAHKVDESLIAAVKQLESVQFEPAVASQKAVVDGLAALLYQVGQGMGTRVMNFGQLLQMVADIKGRQQVLHARTGQSQTAPEPRRIALAGEQRDIHRDIGVLSDRLSILPEAKAHLDLAKASAVKATAALTAGTFPGALPEQKAVLDSLTRIEGLLQVAQKSAKPQWTADEMATQVQALAGLDVAMARIRAQHTQAEEQFAGAPAAAAQVEKGVADNLAAEKARYPNLPETVNTRLDQARLAALDAVKQIPTGRNQAQAAVRSTSEALDHAHAEVKRALADAQRHALGLKIGELAKAIDAIERAAVAEKAQSVRALNASRTSGFDTDPAKDFVDEQNTVASVTGSVAEAVVRTAPQAVEPLKAILPIILQARDRIAKDPSAKSAAAASKDAAKASDLLAEATRIMRGEIARAADELDRQATAELLKVDHVAQQVDEVLRETRESAAEKLAQLDEASQEVLTAQAEQYRALGQEDLGRAVDIVNRLNHAASSQASATAARRRFTRGESNTPLDAVNEQQKVSDTVERLTEAAAQRPQAVQANKAHTVDPMSQSLLEAKQASDVAVASILQGDMPSATAAAQAAQKALAAAAKQATAEAGEARKAKAGQPSADAQQRVTDAAAKAASKAATAAPPAAEQLTQAAEKSKQATKQLEDKKPADAGKSQAAVAGDLKAAAAKIEAAKKQLAAEAKQQLAKAGTGAAKAASDAKNVDPTASSALKRAAEAAKEAAKTPAEEAAKQAPQANKDVQKNVQQAASNLDARKNELQRDKTLADTIKQLAAKQQKARENLAALGAQMTNPTPQDGKAAKGESDQGEDSESGKKPPSGKTPPAAPAAPAEAGKDTGSSESGDQQASKQKPGTAPPAASPGGQSGQAPGGDQPAPEKKTPDSDEDEDEDDTKKAEGLASALGDYIGAQEGLGELAEKLSDQKKVANKPLQKALNEAAKLDPKLDRAKNPMFIPPAHTPVFEPSSAPPLPPQIAGSGAMPEQGKQDPKDAEGAIKVPEQTQGPQSPPSALGQAENTNNPQVEKPPNEGVNASTIVQTSPITSPPQAAAPPSAPGVFEPNEGKPKSATPSSNSTPPKGSKPQGEKLSPEQAEKAIEEFKQAQKDKKKVRVKKKTDGPMKQPPAPPGQEFMPQDPEETAQQIAGEEAIEKAIKKLKKKGKLDDEAKDALGAEDEDEPEIEYVEETPETAKKQAEPEEAPDDTGTTPGDLGQGQGTPGKGVGGESVGEQTEDRPQKGNQHGRFDGKRDAEVGDMDLKPKGFALPPGFKPKDKDKDPEGDPFALPEQKDEEKYAMPDVDPNAPSNFGGGKDARIGLGVRTSDVRVKAVKIEGEPWFAKLPPEIRTAIQSSSKTDPPRGYEEKLRRYRESVK